ncbi:SEC-C motif protein [Perilla frutescens var. hirtella]|uniref:SEC-C motif protein n=1 Tax=Perilla frutescens var. hirtella TaxID=608512 RepID=A0AAD4J3G5_PERFH|nr:SEC-C motif protein [Perilla frutescens var. hirtella]KAH6826409.1 SEC-C motif protein [Perilla frutescens var. hirtella]
MLRSILSSPYRRNLNPSTIRCICTTPHLSSSWVDKVKGVFTGQKTESSGTAQSFTLLRFAEEMRKARKLGTLKQFVVGRSSEATFADAFEKQEAIIRYLGGVDPTGENIQTSHKNDAAKQCNCTVAEVENTLAKFTWAKAAQVKLEQLQAEGKPMPKSMAEIQKMMGTSPMDVARSNLAKSGQISRNAPCPCGSKKLYKRYTEPN